MDAPDITFAGPSDIAWGIDLGDPNTPRFNAINGVDINNPKLYVLDAYRIRQDRTSDHEVAGAKSKIGLGKLNQRRPGEG